MKKKIVLIALIALLAIGAGLYYTTKKKGDQPPLQPLQPERKDLIVTVSSSGTINAIRNIEVKSKASGNVLKLHVQDGDVVKKGQLLLELDKTDELSKVRQTQASLMAAQARVNQAEEKLTQANRNYDQQAALANDKLITPEQLLQSTSARNLAAADLKIQQAALINAQEDLSAEQLRFADTEIRSPIDGVVLQKLVEEGQIISSGLSANNGGTLIFVIGDLSRLIAKAEIDEVDISKINVGQKVRLAVDAYDKRTFDGVLTHISPQAITKSNVNVFEIDIEVTDPDKGLLKPGLTATSEIIIDSRRQALTLPVSAVYRKHRHFYVMEQQAGRLVEVPIKKGLENDTDVEILDGVNENDTLYIKPKESNGNSRSGQRRNSQMRMMGGLGGRH